MLGASGVGKSALCNTLAGKDPHADLFPVSAKMDPETLHVRSKTVQWRRWGPKMILIDTPGVVEASQNIEAIVTKVKRVGYVNMFLVLINGQNPRLDKSVSNMLKYIRVMFGSRFVQVRSPQV